MNWFNWRVVLGILLLAAGALALLQVLGIFSFAGSVSTLIISLVFAGGGLAFYSVVVANRENWWAVIPGTVLIDLGAMIFLSEFLPGFGNRFGGSFFLGGIALAFWLVYLLTPQNWWAVIPGGVLTTLAVVAAMDQIVGLESGGVFFLGLGLTFALLAVLPVEGGRMRWPWIPAGVLLAMGILITLSAANLIDFIWPVALILVGIYLLFRPSFRRFD